MTPAVIFALVFLIVAGNILAARVVRQRFFYPRPYGFPPPATDQSMDQLLHRLDEVLRERAPAVARALRPGLSAEQIEALEREYGCRLDDDLRALYRWHDGTAQADFMTSLLPGHRFMPLAEAMAERAEIKRQVRGLPPTQWLFHWIFAGHRLDWLTILSDGCGDGYSYDPARRGREGAFFFHFAEDRTYWYFRTLADFLAGAIECYESGIYRPSAAGGAPDVDEDHVRSQALWPRFAASVG
jgi:cell wall assembly regulator SMI1